jgi:Domain of unknown function (DUF5047)
VLAVSDKFLAALRISHSVRVRALLYRPGNPTPLEGRVMVTGGQIRADRDARVRRQGSVRIAFSLAASEEQVRELPFGGYCAVERGVMFADGVEELVKVGHFRIDSVSWEGEQGEATLTLLDRHAQLQDEPFVTPWSPVGLKPSDAIVDAVEEVFGASIGYDVQTTPASEAAIIDAVYDQDRAGAIGELAAALGAEAYFKPSGDFTLRPSPNLDALAPVWTIDAGEGGVLTAVSENLDRTSVKNGVAVRGIASAGAAPVFSLATDNDPASPTRWGGPFGKVALITSLTGVVTQAQADTTAASLLRLHLGAARTLTLQAVPNPALEPGDAVLVTHPDGREEKQLVNALALPLDVDGAMQLVTTSQYRPEALAAGRRRARERVRIYVGAEALRELEEASLA